jgi:hypothetical protein
MKRLAHCRALLTAVLLSANAMHVSAAAQDKKDKCSESYSRRTINGEVVEDLGAVGLPLRGWVGNLSTGQAVVGMTIDSYSEDGKKRLATTTTNDSGAFSFPELSPGTYYLKGNAKGFAPLRIFVHVSENASTIACIIE